MADVRMCSISVDIRWCHCQIYVKKTSKVIVTWNLKTIDVYYLSDEDRNK